jgi:AcrR family transcriptional regulator
MARTKTISNEELLAVARRVFVEQGFAGATKQIARIAGVSEGVLFQRFPTKAELFFAAMTPPPFNLTTMLAQPGATGLDAVEQVVFALLDYFRETMPVLLPLMSHPNFQFEDFAAKHPDSPLVSLRRELMSFVIARQQAGEIRDTAPGPVALLLWSLAHAIAFYERLGAHGGRFEPEMIRACVRSMWAGFGV